MAMIAQLVRAAAQLLVGLAVDDWGIGGDSTP
jgi:hypothetical protein